MLPRRSTLVRHPAALAAIALLSLRALAASLAVAGPAPVAAPAAVTLTALPVPGAGTAAIATPVTAVPVPAAVLAMVAGGTCTTCSDGGGGGGGGTGSSGTPLPVGSPYWEAYRVSLTSSYYSPAYLASRINNWSSLTINGYFSYTRKVVRDVQFSGAFADFVRASVGGEVSLSTTASVTYPVPPYSYGKLYAKYYTARETYYGHEYQDYNDGSRTIVASDSGPYESTSTVLGYVTGPL